MADLISTQAAWECIVADFPKATSETVALGSSAGRTLAEPVRADRDFPPFTRVMMDGYALRRADLDGERRVEVAGFQRAGEPALALGGVGTCVEVSTGAMCPAGAEVVVPYEQTQRAGTTVRIDAAFTPPPNHFLHTQGLDAKQGDVLLPAGTRLSARQIAVAAACGSFELTVSGLPRLALYSTGDELVAVEATPAPHQLRQSNFWALTTALSLAGFPAHTQGHLPDDAAILRASLAAALEAHEVLVFTGSASKGKADHLPNVLTDLGAQKRFHGVAQRPGKPFGFYNGPAGQAIFLLPGNPLSALVGLHRWVVPACRQGAGGAPSEGITARLAEAFAFAQPMTCFLPVRRVGEGVAPLPANNSGDFTTVLHADGFVELPAQLKEFPAGGSYPFYPWY
ncbi:MAG: molybdopterin molybdotransferase MoeA [Opitutales bacterium]